MDGMMVEKTVVQLACKTVDEMVVMMELLLAEKRVLELAVEKAVVMVH